jgi:hypothetical protein
MSLNSSRSPQSARGSSQDYEQFTKGEVQDSARTGQRVSPENVGASKVTSDLSIESINERAFPTRKK